MNSKDAVLSGTSIVGGGTSVGGIYVAYSQPGTVGAVLKEGGYTLMPFSRGKRNKDKTLWTLVILRYSEEKNKDKGFKDFEIKDIGVSVVNSKRGKLENLCKGLLNTKLTGDDDTDDRNIEKAKRWCAIPDEVTAGVFLKYEKTPIILEADPSIKKDYWKKAYDKYFLEAEDSDKFNSLKGKSEGRDKGVYEDNGHENLQKECETLLGKSGVDNNKDNQEKASKWCVLFTNVGEGKTIDEDNNTGSVNNWKTKYEDAEKDNELKTILQKFLGSETSDEKKANAMKKWCKIAINASDKSKAKIDKCILTDKKKGR